LANTIIIAFLFHFYRSDRGYDSREDLHLPRGMALSRQIWSLGERMHLDAHQPLYRQALTSVGTSWLLRIDRTLTFFSSSDDGIVTNCHRLERGEDAAEPRFPSTAPVVVAWVVTADFVHS
jgi:hypothetical protein